MRNGQGISIQATGNSVFSSSSNTNLSFALNNLLHVPRITKILISVSQFTRDNKCYFEFHPNECFVKSQDTNKTLLQGTLTKEGLYAFHSLIPSYFPYCSLLSHNDFTDLGSTVLNKSVPATSSTLLDNLVESRHNVSNASTALPTAHRLHAPSSTTVYSSTFDLVFVDLWGPSPYYSQSGFRYYLSIVDACSKHTWIFLWKQKSNTLSMFQYFIKYAHTQFHKTIKAVQSDFGGEFRPFTSLLNSLGIAHRLSYPHTHHQQGTVEQKHRHIVKTGLTLLVHAHLPLTHWEYAFTASVYLINRMPTPTLNNISPYQILYGTLPVYSFLKVFGCSCFPLLRPYNSHKLNFRSLECVFIGYSTQNKGYKCLSPDGRIYISKDVTFNEHSFPFLNKSTLSPEHSKSFPMSSSTTGHYFPTPYISPLINSPLNLSNHSPIVSSHSPSNSSPHVTFLPPSPYISSPNAYVHIHLSPTHVTSSSSPSSPLLPMSAHPMQTRSKSGIFKPKVLLIHSAPSTAKAALADPTWKQAMQA
ncbi:PREDICTED: uncharacterized protein LOC109330866 [Lupinus angustifolius]|uniref:uncharacterized protein LOC109330866 n=1 Tax=Lupinus angustifolius TaxID=3871 RepID=UPI00092E6F7C|nr:PREDICTED: uncharacterized protein LOC109330866 [Lupinus angustifolius]